MSSPEYRPRLIDPLIDQLRDELPALLIVGPRATGKTTTAARHVETVVRLDREAEAVAFAADPDVALAAQHAPVLLDEWQAVPQVLGAVKRAVDSGAGPGRFLLTGSVRAVLDEEVWPGTGRLVRVPMYGLTVREQLGRTSGAAFFDRIYRGDELRVDSAPPNLRDYVELALRGGFPESSLHLSSDTRVRWLDSYLEQLLTHDVEQLDGDRDPERLQRFFEVYALNSAGVVEMKTLHDSARINRRTAVAYEQLLTNLLVVEALPAWTSNRLKRLVLSPKRYVVDPALIAAALRVDLDGVLRDGDLLGRIIDTFVLAQLRPEVPVSSSRPRLYHLRQEQGRHEVDIVAEFGGGRIAAIEIKATAAPKGDDARHLSWLREELGDRFVAGLVLHTGPQLYGLGDRIVAAPICSLWS